MNAPINVAQVRQISPFRYPGGKTWLVPSVRKWVSALQAKPSLLVEPFAGGAIVGLSMAAENLVGNVFLSELDDDVAAVWETIFLGTDDDAEWLCKQIVGFEVSIDNVKAALATKPVIARESALRTIVKNRMNRGGILADGAGLIKSGENGRGLHSRWYPRTLARRIQILRSIQSRIDFEKADALDVIRRFSDDPSAIFFIDPPYTAGGKKAGQRLYKFNDLDHEELFSLTSRVKGSAMLTYDDAPEVRRLAIRHGFRVEQVPMKSTHHAVQFELLILKSS